MDILTLMDNGLIRLLADTVTVLIVTILGYYNVKNQYRAKNAERDVKIEQASKEVAVHQQQLELEKTQMELRLQTERAENEKAIREAMILSMRRVDTLEKEQERVKDVLRVTSDQYSEAKELIEDQQAQLTQRDRASERRDKELADLQTRVTSTETEREQLLKIIEQKDKKIEQKDKEIEELKIIARADVQSRDTRIDELTEKMRVMEQELQDVRAELDQLKAKSPDIEPSAVASPPPPDSAAA